MRSSFLLWCCIGIAFIAGCVEPFNPVGPSWDVTLNVPVINHTYTIQEIIDNDPSIFKADQNGVLLYTTSAVFEPTTVGNSLLLTDDSTVFQSISLGTFKIDEASTTSSAITLGSIVPELGPLNGSLSPIPETSFTVPLVPMDTITQFREATIVEGTLIVEIHNNFPTAIDSLTLVFYDQWGDQYEEIVTASFPDTIRSKETAMRSYPLPARKINNHISFSTTGRLLSSSGPVQIDTSAGVQVNLQFTSMRVSEGEARIPEISYTTQRTYQRSDPSSISRAEIQSGQLSLRAEIPFDGSGTITFQIEDLKLPNGDPFKPSIPFAKKQGHIDTTLILDGFLLSAPEQQVHYLVDVHIDDSGDDYLYLDAADSVNGTIVFSRIILKSFSGVLKPISIAVDHPVSIDAQSINKLISGTVRLADASLIVVMQSPSHGFEYDMRGSILGINTKTGKNFSLLIPTDQQRITPGIDSIVFPGSMVAGFLNSFTPNIPDSLTLRAVATINPTGTREGTIRNTDSISGTVRFVLPFHFSIIGGVYQDTVTFDDSGEKGNSDISRDKSRNVQSARISIELENYLPVAVGIDTLRFLDSDHKTLLIIPKQGQPDILVQSGIVTGGMVTQAKKSTSYIELNHADASQFASASYIVISLRLETPTTEPVRFRSTDWVKIKAWSTVNYRANQ